MEIEYIREFLVLAETGNFLEAADHLFISQSSLSKHIKRLETELGTSLFDRTTRKVELNEFGHMFLPYANQITQVQYEYTTAFFNKLKKDLDTITIGTIPVMAHYAITDIMASFKKKNHNITLNIKQTGTEELKEMLRRHECDLAFVRESETAHDEFVRIPYVQESLMAVFPTTHPLANETSVHLKQLEREEFLLVAQSTQLYELCVNACRQYGFEPNVIFTDHKIENLLEMVSKEMGISLLMQKLVDYSDMHQVKSVKVIPEVPSQVNLCYLKGKKLSNAAKHFIHCMELV